MYSRVNIVFFLPFILYRKVYNKYIISYNRFNVLSPYTDSLLAAFPTCISIFFILIRFSPSPCILYGKKEKEIGIVTYLR